MKRNKRFRSLTRGLLRASLIQILAACSVVPARPQPLTQLEPINLQDLHPGTSTEAEIIAKLGTPDKLRHFNEVWTDASYSKASHEGTDFNLRSLELGFKYGVLSSYHYRSNFPEDSTCLNLDRIHNLIKSDDKPKTRPEVLRILGQPTGTTSEGLFGTHHVESYECVTKDRTFYILNVWYASPLNVRRFSFMEHEIPTNLYR